MKKTKIVSTLGPATNTEEKIEALEEAGADVFRFNFSHGDHDGKSELFDTVKNVSDDVALMADTKGPEVRLREVEEDTFLETDDNVILSSDQQKGTESHLTLNHNGFEDSLERGDQILIDDGQLELEVTETEDEVVTEVVHGGEVGSRKSVSVPGKDVGLQAPTKKDRKDLEFAVEKGFDFVSLSFVKHAEDIEKAREIVGDEIDIIAKIEHLKALDNFDEILEAADGIMVARGDLGVEANPAELPLMQKNQIKKANNAGKPVITATQMLESMTENPSATRAEISDVANAVIDGTDAVMLSGETAIGEYPVNTVEFMAEVVEEAEKSQIGEVHHTVRKDVESVAESISKNIWQSSKDTESSFIVAHTMSGSTARNISKYRPEIPIIAFTQSEIVKRQLKLVWGVRPYHADFKDSVDDLVSTSAEKLVEKDIASEEEQVILSAGMPTSVSGTTNMMQIRKIEELI